jgi:hypothetical protein
MLRYFSNICCSLLYADLDEVEECMDIVKISDNVSVKYKRTYSRPRCLVDTKDIGNGFEVYTMQGKEFLRNDEVWPGEDVEVVKWQRMVDLNL